MFFDFLVTSEPELTQVACMPLLNHPPSSVLPTPEASPVHLFPAILKIWGHILPLQSPIVIGSDASLLKVSTTLWLSGSRWLLCSSAAAFEPLPSHYPRSPYFFFCENLIACCI